jgi:hypothetical protein
MADDKVYTPIVTKDAPFPQEIAQTDLISTTTKDVQKPDSIADNPFPLPKYAKEVLSNSLNTKSKKIMQEYQFTRTGSIKVGKYEAGVSGEVAISPDGITGKNKDGEDTFVIDGTEGNAYFQGTIEASTLIGGNLLTGEVMVGDPIGSSFVKIDGANNRIIVNDGLFNRIVIGNV